MQVSYNPFQLVILIWLWRLLALVHIGPIAETISKRSAVVRAAVQYLSRCLRRDYYSSRHPPNRFAFLYYIATRPESYLRSSHSSLMNQPYDMSNASTTANAWFPDQDYLNLSDFNIPAMSQLGIGHSARTPAHVSQTAYLSGSGSISNIPQAPINEDQQAAQALTHLRADNWQATSPTQAYALRGMANQLALAETKIRQLTQLWQTAQRNAQKIEAEFDKINTVLLGISDIFVASLSRRQAAKWNDVFKTLED